MFSLLLEMSIVCQWRNKRANVNKHDIYCFFSVEMTIKCNQLEWPHAFSHHKLEECIDGVIKNCDLLRHDLSQDSTEYELEVYYIDNGIPFNNPKQIDVFFSCAIYTFNDNLSDSFSDTFYSMGMNGHSNNNKLCEFFENVLRIRGPAGQSPQFDIEMDILKAENVRTVEMDHIQIKDTRSFSNPDMSHSSQSHSRSSKDSKDSKESKESKESPVARAAPSIQPIGSVSPLHARSISPEISPHGIAAEMAHMFAVSNANNTNTTVPIGATHTMQQSGTMSTGYNYNFVNYSPVGGDAAQINAEIAFQQAQANAARIVYGAGDGGALESEGEGKEIEEIKKKPNGEQGGENDENEGKDVAIQHDIEKKIQAENESNRSTGIGGTTSERKRLRTTNMNRNDATDSETESSSKSSMDEPQVTGGMTTTGAIIRGATRGGTQGGTRGGTNGGRTAQAIATGSGTSGKNDVADTVAMPDSGPAIGDTNSISTIMTPEKPVKQEPFID